MKFHCIRSICSGNKRSCLTTKRTINVNHRDKVKAFACGNPKPLAIQIGDKRIPMTHGQYFAQTGKFFPASCRSRRR